MNPKPVKAKRPTEPFTVGVYSPSEPIVNSREIKFITGLDILKENEIKIILGKHCKDNSSYMAGSIQSRINDINSLLENNDVEILLASWGGKSSNQLVSYLDYDLILKKRKPILGFSDPCTILNHISAKTGLITFYGPNVVGKLNETEYSNLNIFKQDIINGNLLARNDYKDFKAIKNGKAIGRLVGGNLSTFVLGVVLSDIPKEYFNEKILFWEEIGLPPQLIDQYLTSLVNYGVMERINGMIIGDFITEDPINWKNFNNFSLIKRVMKNFEIPILYAPIFGHKNTTNPIFPINALCSLDTNKMSLELIENIFE